MSPEGGPDNLLLKKKDKTQTKGESGKNLRRKSAVLLSKGYVGNAGSYFV